MIVLGMQCCKTAARERGNRPFVGWHRNACTNDAPHNRKVLTLVMESVSFAAASTPAPKESRLIFGSAAFCISGTPRLAALKGYMQPIVG